MRGRIKSILSRLVPLVALHCLTGILVCAQQVADPNFNAKVAKPAYTRNHPTVVIDEAHSNFHTATGRYKPFADLLTSDGYDVVRGTDRFAKESLKRAAVLVISNAAAPDATADSSAQAFTEAECDVVRDWVSSGGSLLLIADHTPFGSAAASLASRFGIAMGKGFVFDFSHADSGPAVLAFSKENGLLGSHVILRGRDATEAIGRVVSFTGQSLSVPDGATALLKLGSTAHEAPTRTELQAALGGSGEKSETIAAHSRPVPGRAQGIAMKVGKGRLVSLGEAAMFSAQVFKALNGDTEQEFKMGMNVAGNDDRQLALNVLHWLSGLLK